MLGLEASEHRARCVVNTRQGHPDTPPASWLAGYAMAAGAGIGVVLGALFGQLAVGIAIGTGFGLVIGAVLDATAELANAQQHRLVASVVALVLSGAAVALLVVVAD
jgi:hypothetical protein